MPALVPPPHPCRLAQNPLRRALKFSGFVGVQLHGSIFVKKHQKMLLSSPGQPLGRPPAQPTSVPRSGLSNVSETGLIPTTSLTYPKLIKLRQLLSLSDVPQPLSPAAALTSCSRLAPSHPAGPAPSAQSQTGLKACQPETCLRPSPAQVCMKQALPIQQPAQAQLSPACPAQVPGATSSVVRLPGSQQPIHGFAALWRD